MSVATVDTATLAALGEPSRFRIVELLRGGPMSVGDLVDRLGIRQPQVSKHLRVLGDAGLVTAQARHRYRIYRLEREPFAALAHWIDSFEVLWEARLDRLGALLETLDDQAPGD